MLTTSIAEKVSISPYHVRTWTKSNSSFALTRKVKLSLRKYKLKQHIFFYIQFTVSTGDRGVHSYSKGSRYQAFGLSRLWGVYCRNIQLTKMATKPCAATILPVHH